MGTECTTITSLIDVFITVLIDVQLIMNMITTQIDVCVSLILVQLDKLIIGEQDLVFKEHVFFESILTTLTQEEDVFHTIDIVVQVITMMDSHVVVL